MEKFLSEKSSAEIHVTKKQCLQQHWNLIRLQLFQGGEEKSRKMGQGLVIRSLNILLGLFFMFLGSLKITPNIIRDLHKDLRSEYAKYAKVSRWFLNFSNHSNELNRCSRLPRHWDTRFRQSGIAEALVASRLSAVTSNSCLILMLLDIYHLSNT